ncbi:Fic family protein [Halegenticoccus soli]|uniref:Fic family protein n=1 Tax=Halegenticoccus soli TaxID=1985678 RepID=UPI000C6E8248|nr:Fic family protein [Halegenticoccus soli]
MADEIVYPEADVIHGLHAEIVSESDVTDSGVHSPGAIEAAVTYVSEGYFGQAPETIHEKAVHLMRLLVARHPFADGKKRTALKAFGRDAEGVDIDEVVSYLEAHTNKE